METNSPDVLTDLFLNETIIPRKQLLPVWIKIFGWFFLIAGITTPVFITLGLITHSYGGTIYGIEADSIYSVEGVAIALIFLYKGIVAFGLLKQKDWAILTGIADAVLGIVICCAVMIYSVIYSYGFSFRLELAALIPYLLKLMKIKSQWETSSGL